MHAGLHDVAATDLVQATSSHGDVIDIDAVSGLDDASGLEHDGRQLTMFKAAPLLFKAGSSVLDTFLEVAAGALVDGISGSGAVPIDLGALIDDAIKEIDAVVEQSITKVQTHHQSCTDHNNHENRTTWCTVASESFCID